MWNESVNKWIREKQMELDGGRITFDEMFRPIDNFAHDFLTQPIRGTNA